ncbi:hypothetical protein C21_03760 [Arenibacter sp. NBRC 103722]|uniref:PepSY-like domain-containing protein n=1 Tax=unclassified Arenibacter TaxID=2615047 RepID=UPI0008537E2D|nr:MULTISPECIES: PepSY-like domain-containing protein [unclassified Arenibacter]MDX1766421.1 PepSY-like domain-containing protein [Arenibacter troitsensis]HCO83010.1 hypothetical protein [Arenibacter sp.]MCM4164836.1 hypothetical protein [Arenibacter sp. A80]RFT55252.1 hypothetical protein D0S24_14635 [Arenibacter sp. P308M17]GBF21574.1 hypothetical protein C21_03760 [Arenibacter sp. NBRC 103722]|tara:strand:+ start:1170 stop:1622 length:453 start_codon:yes stop_codon:yes gene_type:complete
MKKIKILGAVLFSAVIGSGIYAFDTNKDVPIRVKEAFAKKFPNIKKVKWEKESNSEWEGEFKIKGMEYSANFLEDGTWKETEHEIKRNAIPSNIKTILDTEFSGYKIEEAEISETQSGSVYEFELEKGELNTEITIDLKGNVISKVTSQE